MSLQKVGEFNNVPEDAMPPKLRPKETVVYQLLSGKKNPVPVGDPQRGPDIIFPKSERIPTRDRIKVGGKIVEIGVVEEIDGKEGVVTRTKRLTIYGNDNNGLFSVTEGQVNSEEFYEFLELTNFNESNPNRDQSIEPKFKRVDEYADANMYINQGEAIATATMAVTTMSVGDMRKLAASLNWDSQQDPKLLRGKLMELAIKTPAKFNALVDDPDVQLKALVKRAKEKGIINYIPVEHKWVYSTGTTLAKLDRIEGMDELEGMADWLKSVANGSEIISKLNSMVNKEDKDAKKK